MSQTIRVPTTTYEQLLQRSHRLNQNPDEIVRKLIEDYLHKEDEWQRRFEALLTRVRARSAEYSEDEIDTDIAIALKEVRENRRANRSA